MASRLAVREKIFDELQFLGTIDATLDLVDARKSESSKLPHINLCLTMKIAAVVLFVLFFMSSTAAFSSSAATAKDSPWFVLDVDKATVLGTGSVAWPPMVSVPCEIMAPKEPQTFDIISNTLREIIKPPNVDDLYEWYANVRGTPEADPSWAVVWSTAMALTNYLLANPALVQDKKVVELGAGLGLCGLTAATLGASSVVLTDREPFALHCALSTAACHDGLANLVKGSMLDWCDTNPQQVVENPDVILASDVLYDGETIEAMAGVCQRLVSSQGGLLLIADPKVERFSGARQRFLQHLENVAKRTQVVGLPLPWDSGKSASSMDARDHVRRMNEPTVLIICEL